MNIDNLLILSLFINLTDFTLTTLIKAKMKMFVKRAVNEHFIPRYLLVLQCLSGHSMYSKVAPHIN
jgi:hypothetical protein